MAKQTSTHGGTNMPISSSNPIDFAAIAVEMRGAVARWYNADIQIIDPNLREQTWNEFTNSYGASTESVIWSGKARVQPVGSERLTDLQIAQGSVRAVRFQVPYDATLPLIREGLQIIVTDGGEDVVLESLMFVVTGSVNSSYGWNRTIECEVNLKSPSQ